METPKSVFGAAMYGWRANTTCITSKPGIPLNRWGSPNSCKSSRCIILIVGGSNGHGDHVSIYLDGVLINDPNQYGEGLTGPTSHDYYSIGFLVSGKHKP